MSRLASLTTVVDAYAARSTEYIEILGTMDPMDEDDRVTVRSWAQGVSGKIIDVGCGPGQWTHFLSEQGFDVEGVDPTPEFVVAAQRRCPNDRFKMGRAEQLDAGDATIGGILAWYSLIHTEPGAIGTAFAEFARCLRPGGTVALGFFEGPELIAFKHAVTMAYCWPRKLLSERLEKHGFRVVDVRTRADPGVRAHGFISAVKVS